MSAAERFLAAEHLDTLSFEPGDIFQVDDGYRINTRRDCDCIPRGGDKLDRLDLYLLKGAKQTFDDLKYDAEFGLIAAAHLARHATGQTILLGAAALTLPATLWLHAAPGFLSSTAALILTGATMAPVFPTVMTLAGARYPANTGAVFGVILAPARTGAMLLPWLAGTLSARSNDTRPAITLASCAAGGILLLALFLPRLGRLRSPPNRDARNSGATWTFYMSEMATIRLYVRVTCEFADSEFLGISGGKGISQQESRSPRPTRRVGHSPSGRSQPNF